MGPTKRSSSKKDLLTPESAEHRRQKLTPNSTLALSVAVDLLRCSTSETSAYLQARGEEMHALIRNLYPICRSISGNGVRETGHAWLWCP